MFIEVCFVPDTAPAGILSLTRWVNVDLIRSLEDVSPSYSDRRTSIEFTDGRRWIVEGLPSDLKWKMGHQPVNA